MRGRSPFIVNATAILKRFKFHSSVTKGIRRVSHLVVPSDLYHEDTIGCRLLLLHYRRTSVLNVSCLPLRLRTDRLVINAGHHFPLKHRRRIVRLLPVSFPHLVYFFIIFGEERPCTCAHVSEQPLRTPLLKYWTPVTSVGEYYVVRSDKVQRDNVYE